jgi:hypothetical protein
MFKKVFLVVLVIILIFLGFVAIQPNDFRVSRSAPISAPVETVFNQVNDFHKWEAWSPWIKLDPSAKTSFEGPAAGEGAIFKWEGNNQVGAGTMTLTESRPAELIRIRLDFLKPFPSTGTSEFLFKGDSNQTVVTWNMYGKHSFVEKAVCMFMNMDKIVGGQFEQGLASLNAAAMAETKSNVPVN